MGNFMLIRDRIDQKVSVNKVLPFRAAANTSNSLKLLSSDLVSFGKMTSAFISDLKYKNRLNLKSIENTDFIQLVELNSTISDKEQATIRIKSLSTYLKESMIGFIVPQYTIKGQSKGGYEWFERGLENLLKACKKYSTPDDYKNNAKQLFTLLALHDSFWTSNQFVSYLQELKPSLAINKTIEAINELNNTETKKSISFLGDKKVNMYGFFSPLKCMQELLDKGCAYSGEKLFFDDPDKHAQRPEPFQNASLDHIVPQSWGGIDDDSNFLLTSVQTNSLRGNCTLLRYLRG
jgi:hypothetical protein